MFSLSNSGTRSRRAAFLISVVLRFCGSSVVMGAGASGAGISDAETSGAGAGARTGSAGVGAGVAGVSGMAKSGILLATSSGAMVVGAGVTTSSLGSGNGPTGSPSSPVSPSGTEDGAATGSEKTGSMLVVLVISSIAFCRSLSTLG